MAGKTKIIVSHRISTIQSADEILFLLDGKIVERGNHEELLNFGGQYKSLYDKQLLEEKVNRQEEVLRVNIQNHKLKKTSMIGIL